MAIDGNGGAICATAHFLRDGGAGRPADARLRSRAISAAREDRGGEPMHMAGPKRRGWWRRRDT